PVRVHPTSDWNSASFAGALAIVRNGKPFTDGEYAKTFMLDIANELFDDFSDKDKVIKRIKDMPLSARTVRERTIMMANQIEATQVKDINAAPFFSLALDESTDVSYLSQFSVIARYAIGDTLREESLVVLPMKVTTRGEDLFKSFTEIAKEQNLPLDKLISGCTDGASCIVGKNRGFVALLREHENPLVYYLVDMTERLNQLNVKMQGVGNTVLPLQQAVFAFENKLELFIADIETGPSDPAQHLDLQQLAGFTSNLLQSFKARFGEFREHTRLFKFITHPHECAVDSTDLSYIPGVSVRDFELQVADLKASDMWVNKFKSLNEDLERLARQQAELASKHKWGEMKKLQPADQLIVTTWNALPSSSHLKNIKTNLRSHLMDGSLNACMKLNLTTYQPEYKAISRTMQKSH
uniref:DUF4371 domain-containing protein n=1 Tax=Xenopus tropicalis TaxID=8364 RepID=A0A803JPN2_XENTR